MIDIPEMVGAFEKDLMEIENAPSDRAAIRAAAVAIQRALVEIAQELNGLTRGP